MDAEIGVTGCNFAVANTGSLCLVTNEGNADLVMSIPKHKLRLWVWNVWFRQWKN